MPCSSTASPLTTLARTHHNSCHRCTPVLIAQRKVAGERLRRGSQHGGITIPIEVPAGPAPMTTSVRPLSLEELTLVLREWAGAEGWNPGGDDVRALPPPPPPPRTHLPAPSQAVFNDSTTRRRLAFFAGPCVYAGGCGWILGPV
jgi:hypothetical protein